tara:strand:- start:1766 stop:1927 length:162 start_codon:yes stop_codon:yes gene_type:complete
MSMEDYIISQLYLKLEKILVILENGNIDEVKHEIKKVKDELEKYGQDNTKVFK